MLSERRHIIVVSAEARSAGPLTAEMIRHGYEAHLAEDAVRAIRIMKAGLPCSAIVLDLELPRQGAQRVLRAMSASRHMDGVPVVLVGGGKEPTGPTQPCLEDVGGVLDLLERVC